MTTGERRPAIPHRTPQGVSQTLARAGVPRAGRYSVWGQHPGFQVVRTTYGAEVFAVGAGQKELLGRIQTVLTGAGYDARLVHDGVAVRWGEKS